jgi:ABC-2 type transport system permease protein
MSKIIAQTIKELTQLSRDKLTLALGLLLPLLTLLIFGYAIRMEAKNIPLAVQDFDSTPASRKLVECLIGTNQLRLVEAGHDIQTALDKGRAKVGIVIPPGFARKLAQRQTAPIQVMVNGIDINNARVVQNSVIATCGYFARQYTGRPDSAIDIDLRLIFNPGRAEPLFIVPGIYAIVLAIYPAFLSAIAMVREQEQGTIVQVYGSAMTPAQFIFGKLFAYTIFGIVEACVVMTVGFLCFQIRPQGDITPLLVCTLCYLFTNVLVGLFGGACSRAQLEAIQSVATMQFMTSMLLSGFLYPKFSIPYPISLLTYLVPAGYYIDVTRSVFVRGTGWQGLVAAPFVLILMSLLLFTLTWLRLRPMKFREPA